MEAMNDCNTSIQFGKRIRTVRQNAGCTQNEFSSLLGIPQSTLSAYETDRMQPTVSSLVKIATKFNVSLDWLCGIKKVGDLSSDLSAALIEAEEFLKELELRREREKSEIEKLLRKLKFARARERDHK